MFVNCKLIFSLAQIPLAQIKTTIDNLACKTNSNESQFFYHQTQVIC